MEDKFSSEVEDLKTGNDLMFYLNNIDLSSIIDYIRKFFISKSLVNISLLTIFLFLGIKRISLFFFYKKLRNSQFVSNKTWGKKFLNFIHMLHHFIYLILLYYVFYKLYNGVNPNNIVKKCLCFQNLCYFLYLVFSNLMQIQLYFEFKAKIFCNRNSKILYFVFIDIYILVLLFLMIGVIVFKVESNVLLNIILFPASNIFLTNNIAMAIYMIRCYENSKDKLIMSDDKNFIEFSKIDYKKIY